jgi:hypothetical protein
LGDLSVAFVLQGGAQALEKLGASDGTVDVPEVFAEISDRLRPPASRVYQQEAQFTGWIQESVGREGNVFNPSLWAAMESF